MVKFILAIYTLAVGVLLDNRVDALSPKKLIIKAAKSTGQVYACKIRF